MSEVLVHVNRGPIMESCHRGDVVVVNTKGQVLASIGDPYKVTYIRSAGKPLQAINVFLSGAESRFGFSDEEISIMCASHYGEDFHRDNITRMLDKLELPLEALKCGSTYSIKPEIAREQMKSNVELKPYNNDCSGKHTGMLAACLVKGYSTSDYTEMDHPVQKDVLEIMAEMCEIAPEDIVIGIDGCSVPVHGFPLYNMALGYARLANPDDLEPKVKEACNRIFQAMNNSPEMVSGTNGFCSELIKHTNGKLIGKLGAEGVYCIGIKDMEIGLAIKIEDGNYSRAINPAVMRCLEDLNILTEEEIQALNQFRAPDYKNGIGMIVGNVSPVFHLIKG